MIDNTVTLKAGDNNDTERISFITTLLNNAENKINHFDGVRQRNLVVAIAVFSGLSSFVLKASSDGVAISLSISIMVIMGVFFILDSRFRRYSHGWQETSKKMVYSIKKIINNPNDDAIFPRYDEEGENIDRYWSVISWLYVVLFVGGGLSYVVYKSIQIEGA